MKHVNIIKAKQKKLKNKKYFLKKVLTIKTVCANIKYVPSNRKNIKNKHEKLV